MIQRVAVMTNLEMLTKEATIMHPVDVANRFRRFQCFLVFLVCFSSVKLTQRIYFSSFTFIENNCSHTKCYKYAGRTFRD